MTDQNNEHDSRDESPDEDRDRNGDSSPEDSYDDRAPLGTEGRPHYIELPIDDICPGKFVTLCRGPFQSHMHFMKKGYAQLFTEDRRLHGYPMQVLAVNLPFVSVKLLACIDSSSPRAVYDVRNAGFREVSEAYVKSLLHGTVDQGDTVANGGVESTNPHALPGEVIAEIVVDMPGRVNPAKNPSQENS